MASPDKTSEYRVDDPSRFTVFVEYERYQFSPETARSPPPDADPLMEDSRRTKTIDDHRDRDR